MAEYTEYEVRTVPADSRKYNIAKFSHDNSTKGPVPDFGKGFKKPVHMKYEEVPLPAEDQTPENEDEPSESRGFRKRKRYYNRKEYRWLLQDAEKKQVYHGVEEGQSSSYVVFIPPTTQGAPFRVVPVEKWFNFKKAPNYKALTMEQAEDVINSKMRFTSTRMKRLVERQKEAYRQDGNDVEKEEEESIFAVPEIGKKGKAVKPTEENNDSEEDIEVSAIDRMVYNGTDSFADVVDDPDAAQDNDDDGAEFAAGEVRDSEERLLQGAEDLREAAEDEELADGGGNENVVEDYDEEIEDVLDSEQVGDLNRLDEEQDDEINSERMKVFSEKYYRKMATESGTSEPKAKTETKNQATTAKSNPSQQAQEAASTKVEAQPEAAKPKPPEEPKRKTLGESIAEIIRHNGGKMKTKSLLKEAKKKGLVDDIKVFKAALTNVCSIEDDVVHGKMLVLKK